MHARSMVVYDCSWFWWAWNNGGRWAWQQLSLHGQDRVLCHAGCMAWRGVAWLAGCSACAVSKTASYLKSSTPTNPSSPSAYTVLIPIYLTLWLRTFCNNFLLIALFLMPPMNVLIYISLSVYVPCGMALLYSLGCGGGSLLQICLCAGGMWSDRLFAYRAPCSSLSQLLKGLHDCLLLQAALCSACEVSSAVFF